MGYDNRKVTRYQFDTLDFGTAGEIYVINGPKGKTGLLVDYGVVHVTETFTANTLPAYVSVGTAADADAYGDELSMGLAAADGGGKSVLSTYRPGKDSGYATQMLDRTLPADTPVALHCTAPTGGTPAGMACPFLEVIWDD